jgi:type II secretory pathway pseudopilin PulG
MADFLYSPQVGAQVLATFGAATSAPVLAGTDAQQGLMAALVNAELMAAAKSFATPITVGGATGVIIGGAHSKAGALAKEGNPDAILYLAQHANVRSALAQTVPAPGASATTQLQPVAFPLIPVLIAVSVVAIAGAVAVAYWSKESTVRTEQNAAKQVAAIDGIVRASTTGQAIDPAVLQALTSIANKEATEGGAALFGSPTVFVLGGAAALAAVLYFANKSGR